MNDVWIKMAEFLGRLNGESVSRETYEGLRQSCFK